MAISACANGVAAEPVDLLFNCNLAGQKRPMVFEAARRILWDAGQPYQASIDDITIDARYVHDWSADTKMRHHLVIPRNGGTFTLEVDEIDATGRIVNEMVRETGTCSPGKIHPRNLSNDSQRLKHQEAIRRIADNRLPHYGANSRSTWPARGASASSPFESASNLPLTQTPCTPTLGVVSREAPAGRS